MTMKKTILTLTTLLALPLAVLAHEGHPEAKGDVSAPNGGLIKPSDEHYFEVLTEGPKLSIYAYDIDLKTLPQGKIELAAQTQLPGQALQPLKLTYAGDRWQAAFDAGSAHRYTLKLTKTHDGHSDTATFTIEPGAM